jgi:U4/U6.U5 tri-snRNP-associated protein 1
MPEESISLEETNKIRISLGLKPLTDDNTGKTETKEQEAENNYAKRREQEVKDREAKCVCSVVH